MLTAQKNPILSGYTWSNGITHSRIDFLLTSMGLQVVDTATTPVFFSDHHTIECSVMFKDIMQKGRGSWKLNISLLQDEKVVSEFRVKLNQWLSLKPFFNLMGEWWEEIKIRAKHFFIDWGKRTAKKETSETTETPGKSTEILHNVLFWS